jgi:hypothetical protein
MGLTSATFELTSEGTTFTCSLSLYFLPHYTIGKHAYQCICLLQRRGLCITLHHRSYLRTYIQHYVTLTIPLRGSHADHVFAFTSSTSRHGAFLDIIRSAIVVSSQLYYYAFKDRRRLGVGATLGHHYRTTSDPTCLY